MSIILLPSVEFGVAHAQLKAGTHNFCTDLIFVCHYKKSIKSNQSIISCWYWDNIIFATIPCILLRQHSRLLHLFTIWFNGECASVQTLFKALYDLIQVFMRRFLGFGVVICWSDIWCNKSDNLKVFCCREDMEWVIKQTNSMLIGETAVNGDGLWRATALHFTW